MTTFVDDPEPFFIRTAGTLVSCHNRNPPARSKRLRDLDSIMIDFGWLFYSGNF